MTEPASAYWSELEKHFHALADLETPARENYLREHCQDRALRQELIELLDNDVALETGVATLIAEAADELSGVGVEPGELFGPWRVLRLLAEGGMGAVFLAERADGQFERRVALKVLRLGLSGELLASRFRHERQILANLRHPHIATLLDGGANERGQPYLVMEFIDGRPINQYCREQRLPLSDRLRLMQKICGAVQFAHQSLIVHRDIKPGNILVDHHGEPSLLDFGIAKLMEADAADAEAAPKTRVGERLLTLEYASPEQILGRPVGTSSDVFSLGVLLYELFTGQSPFEHLRDQPLALQQAICHSDPTRPSDLARSSSVLHRHQTREFRRQLRGDLDHIVFKAMRKEPEQRYSSPAALADDIQRFLEHQPIQARRDSRRYVFGKFMRRNAIPLGTASVVVVVIATLISFYTQRLVQARNAAERVSGFMVDIFKAANTNTNRPDILARDVLDAAATRVEAELNESPIIKAQLLRAIGESYGGIRLNTRAEELLRAAVVIMRKEVPADDPVLADTLRTLGEFLIEAGYHDEAEALNREALQIYRKRFGQDDLRVATTLIKLEQIIGQSRHDTSLERHANLEEAMRILRLAGRENSEAYIVALGSQGSWHRQRFDWPAADAAILEQLRLTEKLNGPNHIRNAFNIENLARQYYFHGRYADAIPLFERTIAIIEEFKGVSHLDMDWSLYYLGRIRREMGQAEQARALMDRVVAQERATPQTGDNRYLGRALCGQALVLADAGALDRAQSLCEHGRDILAPTIAHQKRVQLDVAHEALGVIALARGDVAGAVRELGAMAEVLRKELDPGQTDTPLAIGMHASALAAAERYEEAESLFSESLEMARHRYGENYPTRGRVFWARALAREQAGKPDEAKQDRKRAQAIFQQARIQPQNGDWTISPRR